MKKVALIHPLKHHAFSVMRGIKDYNPESIALFGFYNKGDFIDRLLEKTSYAALAQGYKDDEITECVKTNCVIKLLFLLFRKNPKAFKNLFFTLYQLWCIPYLKDVDCIYVLNNYCNIIIRYAVRHHIKIVYDQIIAFNYKAYYDDKKLNKTEYMFNKKQKAEIWNLQNADLILAPSEFVRESLQGYFFSDDISNKIVIVPYGGVTEEYNYKKRKVIAGTSLKLLFVGTITKRKGLDYLIDAVKLTDNPDITLTIIGACNDEKSKDILNRIGDCKNINYIGTVPHVKIKEYYLDHHVFCLPSMAEGSSLSTFEALSTGMPCIVTQNAGSTITDGVEGYIVRCGSAEDIADRLSWLYHHPEEIEKMSELARKNAEINSCKQFSIKVGELIRKVLME